MKRALVTGATGFLGSHLVARLIQDGWAVHAVTRPSSDRIRLDLHDVTPSVMFHVADIAHKEDLAAAVTEASPEVVFHLAAYGARAWDNDAQRTWSANAQGGANVAQAAVAAGADRIVWMGSGFEYARAAAPIDEGQALDPVNAYATAKLEGWREAQRICAASRTDLVTARLFSAYGPMENVRRLIPHVITQALRGLPIELTAGNQTRDYVHAQDVATALMAIAEHAPSGNVYNVGTGKPSSVREVVDTLMALLPDAPDVRFGARVAPPGEPTAFVSDPGKLKKLRWRPTFSLREGLRATVDWYATHGESWEKLP